MPALVMHQPAGVTRFYEARHRLVVFAIARLVAQRPHNYTGVVFVALEQPLHAVYIRGLPVGMVGNKISVARPVHAVRLEIAFVNDVQSQHIAQRRQTRVVGIVRGADYIAVVRFDDEQIIEHVFIRRRVTEQRVAVMAVHALDLNLLTVDIDDFIFHFDPAEPEVYFYKFTAAMHVQRVEVRCFVRPFKCVGDKRAEIRSAVRVRRDLALADNSYAVGRKNFHCDLGRSDCFKLDLQAAVFKLIVKLLTHKHVAYMRAVAIEEINLAEDTRQPPHVLILEICAVAPFEHQHFYRVLPRAQEFCGVKLTRHVANLAVADEGVIYPHIKARIHALKVEENVFSAQHARRNVKVAHIQPAGVIVGHVRRVAWDGIVYVGITRHVVAVVKLVLPAFWHRELIHSAACEARDGEILHVIYRRVKFEIPIAAQ